MENKMPTMPSKEDEVTLPGEEEIKVEAEVKPEYITPEKNNDSVVNIPKFPKNGIKVVATRKGFYNQKRISEGEEFVIKCKEHLGEWMQCTDKALERERVKFFKEKKAKRK